MSILKTISINPAADNPSAYDITITGGKFSGIVYRLGEISFPEEDEPVLSFTYDIIAGDNLISDKKELETFIGDAIIEMLKEQLENGNAIYKGGV